MPVKRAKNKQGERKRLDLPSQAFRTSVANGSRILDGVDGRSLAARRFAEVAAAIASDLGGEDHVTELQRHLIRSVSGMVVLRERLDAKSINGESVNTAQYCRLANSTRRVAATLGLSRVAKDVTPDLQTYLASKYSREAEEAETDA